MRKSAERAHSPSNHQPAKYQPRRREADKYASRRRPEDSGKRNRSIEPTGRRESVQRTLDPPSDYRNSGGPQQVDRFGRHKSVAPNRGENDRF